MPAGEGDGDACVFGECGDVAESGAGVVVDAGDLEFSVLVVEGPAVPEGVGAVAVEGVVGASDGDGQAAGVAVLS